jgi:DNA (cytosine-5)-methyltransferase 1
LSSLIIDPLGVKDKPFVEMPSGLLLPEWTAQQFLRPTAIDLFAGAGGMSLGLMQGGFDVVAAVDADPLCAITYMYNLGAYPCRFHFVSAKDEQALEKALWREHEKKKGLLPFPVSGANRDAVYPDRLGVEHFWLGDIRKISGQEILAALGKEAGQIDLVAGGPPCQGFSTSGKRQIADPRNNLIFEFARLVLEIRPRYMVMENVPSIMSMVTPDGLPVVDLLCDMLDKGGWGKADTFRRCLATQGGIGLIRGKPPVKKPRQKKKKTPAPGGAKSSIVNHQCKKESLDEQ